MNASEIFEMVVAGTTNFGYMAGKGVELKRVPPCCITAKGYGSKLQQEKEEEL